MKTCSRIVIVLAVLNLAMGSLAFAQAQPEGIAPPEQPAPQVVAGAEEPLPAVPAPPRPPGASVPVASSGYPAGIEAGPRMLPGLPGPSDGQRVLVIPSAEVKAEELATIMEDMQVMSHILDKRFRGSRQVAGVFMDFGDFFGRDSRVTQAIYLQGYGALFLMEGNFPLSPPPKEPETKAEKAEEPVDTVWENAKQEMFSPQESHSGPAVRPGQEYDAEKIEELKRDLVRTLKHAANIRSLKADEWVILSVIGAGQQASYEIIQQPQSTTRPSSSRTRRGSSYGLYGESAGGGGFGFGGGFGMGGFGGVVMGTPSATILTIRVKKSDVDAFAKGDLDFEQFQKQVKIIMYSAWGLSAERTSPPNRYR